MPFIETDMQQETEELNAMIDADPELQIAASEFNREYEFRRKLVAARKAAGLTQKELGNKSGLPYRAISRMESNTDISPNIRTVLRSLSALGYDLEIVKSS
jgi:DNA-binding XRE family transcriptional regulator